MGVAAGVTLTCGRGQGPRGPGRGLGAGPRDAGVGGPSGCSCGGGGGGGGGGRAREGGCAGAPRVAGTGTMEGQSGRCKIVVVGDAECGKTALLQVFAKDAYPGVRDGVWAPRPGVRVMGVQGCRQMWVLRNQGPERGTLGGFQEGLQRLGWEGLGNRLR